MLENNEMTNLQKLDFAIEKTIDKFARMNKSFEYKENFVLEFAKKGFVPSLFTRDENARNLVMDLDTKIILSEILQYATRAKYISIETRYDEDLIKKYPFMKFGNLIPLEYASISQENLKNVIKFFIEERYASNGYYKKSKVDTKEAFDACDSDAKKINEFLSLKSHQL